jgi:hypothetical protein
MLENQTVSRNSKTLKVFQKLSIDQETFPDTFMRFRKGFRSGLRFWKNAFFKSVLREVRQHLFYTDT